MTPPTIIGIDPGLTGAIACLHADTGALIWVEDMPVDRADRCVDIGRLLDLLRPEQARMVWIESADMGRQFTGNREKQLLNLHLCVGAVLFARLPWTYVKANVWTAADPTLKVPKTDGMTRDQHIAAKKVRRRERAGELYPAHRDLFAKAKHDGRADAVLIARWGWEAQR